MGPQDYRINVASPIQRLMAEQDRKLAQDNRDRQFGIQTRQLDMREEQNTQRQQNFETQFGYQKGLDDKKAEYLASEKQRASDKLKEISDFAEKPNKTAQDYSDMINANPDIGRELKMSYDMLDEANQKTAVTEATQVFAAIESGSVDVAETILRRRMEAAKNSGDAKSEAGARGTLEILKANPDAAKATIGLFLASAEPKVFDALNMSEERQYRRGRDAKTDARYARTEARAVETGKRADKRLDATIKREMVKDTAAAKKAGLPRNTTTAEMQSLFNYGDEQGLEQKDVAKIMNDTRGQSVEERLSAIDAFANGGETKADKAAAKKLEGTAVKDGTPKGFKIQHPTTGEVYVESNGKWKKVE